MTSQLNKLSSEYGIFMSPLLYFFLGDMKNATKAASALGWNLVLHVAIPAVHVTVTALVWKIKLKGKDFATEGCAKAKFPSLTVTAYGMLLQGTTHAAVQVMSEDSASWIAVAAVGIVFVSFPYLALSCVCTDCFTIGRDATYHPYKSVPWYLTFITPQGQWLPPIMIRRIGAFVSNATPDNQGIKLHTVSAVFMVLLATVTALPEKVITCDTMKGVSVSLMGIMSMYYLVFRPHRVLFECIVSGIIFMIQMTIVIMTFAEREMSNELEALILISEILVTMKTVASIFAKVWTHFTNKRLEKEEKAEKEKDIELQIVVTGGSNAPVSAVLGLAPRDGDLFGPPQPTLVPPPLPIAAAQMEVPSHGYQSLSTKADKEGAYHAADIARRFNPLNFLSQLPGDTDYDLFGPPRVTNPIDFGHVKPPIAKSDQDML